MTSWKGNATPHSPDRANRHRKLAALVPIGSEAKAASQGTQSATQLLAEQCSNRHRRVRNRLLNCSQSEHGTPEGSQPCVTPY
ncbi:MAG: hypothetical protein ACI30C_02970 [Muribaculaceae bacterium]